VVAVEVAIDGSVIDGTGEAVGTESSAVVDVLARFGIAA
jgi:hypothetical protein